MLLGTTTGSWKILFGILESFGKVLEFVLGDTAGTLRVILYVIQLRLELCRQVKQSKLSICIAHYYEHIFKVLR